MTEAQRERIAKALVTWRRNNPRPATTRARVAARYAMGCGISLSEACRTVIEASGNAPMAVSSVWNAWQEIYPDVPSLLSRRSG